MGSGFQGGIGVALVLQMTRVSLAYIQVGLPAGWPLKLCTTTFPLMPFLYSMKAIKKNVAQRIWLAVVERKQWVLRKVTSKTRNDVEHVAESL